MASLTSAGKQQGFTYIWVMLVVAAMGFGLAAIGEFTSHAQQREKEVELLFAGNQIRLAIEGYYNNTPGVVKQYPQTLEDLLQDKRYPVLKRYLRKLYADPMTGKAEWGVVNAPQGGIMGVYSLSGAAPIKTRNFNVEDRTFTDAEKYADWKFFYSPTGLPQATPAK